MSSIRLAVEALTERAGISQAEIARSLGVPKKTFNAWLTGRVACRHAHMLGLALEALSARLSVERRRFTMGKVIKDATIVKTHRLTAEITGGAGKHAIQLNIDEKYADALSSWYDVWYHGLIQDKPEEGQEKIGDTPEEAVDWWVKKQGFSYGR